MTLATSGAATTTIGLALGVMLPVALLPAGIGLVAGAALARRRLSQVEAVFEIVRSEMAQGKIAQQDTRHHGKQNAIIHIFNKIVELGSLP